MDFVAIQNIDLRFIARGHNTQQEVLQKLAKVIPVFKRENMHRSAQGTY